MKLWSEPSENAKDNICCSVEASTAARAVAKKLDIPFYVVNFSDEFKKLVVDDYIKEYESGRTPNPCVICNRDIKGQLLFQKMKELGGDYLATGHYCRIQKDGNSYHLLKSKDDNKDQTYFLWTLTQEHLAHLMFPVGDLTKPQVRQLASKYNLPTAQRRESQGICFIPDRDVAGFLKRYAKKLTKPGAIIDINGKKIGEHQGLVNYTIGQREGLGLGGPKSYYVVKLEVKTNSLIVGDDKDLFQKDLIASNCNWIASENGNLKTENELGARIRHGHGIEKCEIKAVSREQLAVSFSDPQRAITPGQSIVFYQNEEVLGGGVIENSDRRIFG
jgi:tRNA-specific 2-thiouridylase